MFMQIKRKLDLTKHHVSRLKTPHDVFNTLYTVIMLLKKKKKSTLVLFLLDYLQKTMEALQDSLA